MTLELAFDLKSAGSNLLSSRPMRNSTAFFFPNREGSGGRGGRNIVKSVGRLTVFIYYLKEIKLKTFDGSMNT